MKGKKKYSKHRSRHTINFYSDRNNCHIWCESFLERRYALYLEFDESVGCYASQPEFFNVYGSRYSPDFLVRYKSGFAEYIEVKHSSFMDDEFFDKFSRRKATIFSLTKLDLKLVSEKDFDDVVTENYELLKGYKQLNTDDLHDTVKGLPKTLSLAKLEKLISKVNGATPAHAWALVANHQFHFDTSKPFGTDTKLMRA